jgi:predicted dehydrogenase
MPDRLLRAAVLGAGWYAAQNHIPVLQSRPEVILDGVSRLGAAELERARAHFGFAFASEDFAEVLARRPDIVVISTPHHLHYTQAKAALEAGAHVLCEKPMTLDSAEAWDLVRIARERHLHLLVANGYNYLPQVDALRQKLAEGLIGTIEHAMASFISVTRDVFLGDRGLNQWKTTFFRPEKSTWQDPGQGGGFAYGQMSHCLALLFFLTGLTPVDVSARAYGPGAVDLVSSATLQLSTGALVSLSGAAAMPQGNRGLMRLFITGSEGVLIAEFDRDVCEIRRNDGGVERLDLSEGAWIYNCRGPVNALVDLALGRGVNLSRGEIGATTTATIAAMLASARSGGTPQPILVEG